jgi:hypothetical protein
MIRIETVEAFLSLLVPIAFIGMGIKAYLVGKSNEKK